MLMGKELTASTIATLNFVANQNGIMLVAQLTQSLQEFSADHTDTAYTLNALYDTGTNIILLYLLLPSLDIIEGKICYMSVGIDGGNNLGIVGCLNSQRGTAVKSLLQGKHTGTTIVEGRELQCILVSLSTRVDKEQTIVLIAASLTQALCKLLLQRVLYRVAIEAQLSHLAADSLYIMWMSVTNADYGVSAIQVQILLSLTIPHMTTLATFYGYIKEWIYIKQIHNTLLLKNCCKITNNFL